MFGLNFIFMFLMFVGVMKMTCQHYCETHGGLSLMVLIMKSEGRGLVIENIAAVIVMLQHEP